MNKTIAIVGAVILLGVIVFGVYFSMRPAPLDAFASCIKDSGATFYGAFWCPHCQAQKALFGRSDRLLPYVECSTPDGNNQTEECKEKQITNYPTWEFSDGSRLVGEIALADLAAKTSCTLPE